MSSSCPLCQQSFDSSLSHEFWVHVNGCLDLEEQQQIPKNFHVEDEARLHPLMKKQKERQQAPDCVVCGKAKATAAHIKKCGKQFGVTTSQLVHLVGVNEEQNANKNLQNIVLKDPSLDQEKMVNQLFTDASQAENRARDATSGQSQSKPADGQPSGSQADYSKYFVRPKPIIDESSTAEHPNDFTLVLDKPNQSAKNRAQTKLKVVRKSKTKKNDATSQKLPDGFVDDAPLHAIKKKRTVKLKRKPLAKANLEDKIIQNFKDEYQCEKELPKSWKMANLSYYSSDYVVDGFDEFCKPFDFKDSMNGFEIGLENKK